MNATTQHGLDQAEAVLGIDDRTVLALAAAVAVLVALWWVGQWARHLTKGIRTLAIIGGLAILVAWWTL